MAAFQQTLTDQQDRVLAFVRRWRNLYDCPAPHSGICHDLNLSEPELLEIVGPMIVAGWLVRSRGGLSGYDLALGPKA